MKLRTRQIPDYINTKVKNELKQKGFSVYNYISLRELILTARKDFLGILSIINVPLLVLTMVIGFIAYGTKAYLLLPAFLFLVFFLIFIYIFIKLLLKTKLFLYVSDVVFTKKGLMISDDFLYYFKDEEKIKNKLEKYQNVFLEYLGKPSKLEEVILKKKEEVLKRSFDTGWSIIEDSIGNISSSRGNGAAAAIILFVSMLFYIASIYIFYFLGYFVLYLLGLIYSFFLKIIISLKDKKELKIKQKTIEIDNKLKKLSDIYLLLKNKINEFKSGKIFNLETIVEDKLKDFYLQMQLIIKQQEELKNIILNSKYKDFIDFSYFKSYLKKEFNKPVKDMISLLNQYEKMLIKQLQELKKLNRKSGKQKLDINNTEILDKNLEQKEIILNQKLENLRKNKMILEKSLLK